MADWSQTWTFFRRRLARGQRAALGRAHARDLARLLGVRRRARVRGRGARPRPALRARQRLGQDHVPQAAASRSSSGSTWCATASSASRPTRRSTSGRCTGRSAPGRRRCRPIRNPRAGASRSTTRRCASPKGFSITLSPFQRPTHRDRAGRRQGRLPLSQQRARHAGGALARLRQLHRLRRARQCRRARQLQRVHGQGRRGASRRSRTARSSTASPGSA